MPEGIDAFVSSRVPTSWYGEQLHTMHRGNDVGIQDLNTNARIVSKSLFSGELACATCLGRVLPAPALRAPPVTPPHPRVRQLERVGGSR